MKVMGSVWMAVALAAGLASVCEGFSTDRLQAPAGDRVTTICRSGETVLPNGRVLTPHGTLVQTAPHPYGMVIANDGKMLVTVNGGIAPFSLSLVREIESSSPCVCQIPPGSQTDEKVLPSVFMGAAIDSKKGVVYASEGNTGNIAVFDLVSGERRETYLLNAGEWTDSFPTDIALSPDHKRLYALDLANFRLVTIDVEAKKVVASVDVGRNPFALALTPDGKRAYVANMGTFRYSLVETKEGDDPRGLKFPPFGYPSKEAREGTVVEGRRVPGLGDPNVEEACSVWGIDISETSSPRVIAKVKTGVPVGEAVGGSSPAAVAVGQGMLFVSNSTNDTVEAYDLKNHRLKWKALLAPVAELSHLRGVLPFGLCLSPDAKRLFVAESGINALGVLDAKTGQVLGHIPTGLYPAKVCVSPDGRRLYVSNAKGFGAGPNGGRDFHPGGEGTSIGRLTKGSVCIMDVPGDSEFKGLTAKVIHNNGFEETKTTSDALGTLRSRVKHVVFIAKENRTFDEVFGDMPGVNGDPELARFGMNRRVCPPDSNASTTVGVVLGVNVMPNHRLLAGRFSLCDNFYVESDVSADGHHWLVNAYANHWVETITAAGYGGGASFKRSKAPGRLALFGSNSSLEPEDYLEHGALWEHLERNHISFRTYGEGFELAGEAEEEEMEPTGIRLPVNVPLPAPLFKNISRDYPTFNMNIPDQYRADQFLKEFRSRYLSGKESLPQFIYILLPGDHGADVRPAKGYPYLESYEADNDLALGRIIEALSHSPYWKEMAVFVTEDDAQNGVDHVDAHRSVCLAISPWVKRGHILRRHTSISSIFKTAYRLLGMPALNLCDAAASDLGDMFSLTPDFAPYQVQPVDSRIFDPEKARDASDPDYKRAARERSVELDSAEEGLRQQMRANPNRP